jgi:hypothetical protein
LLEDPLEFFAVLCIHLHTGEVLSRPTGSNNLQSAFDMVEGRQKASVSAVCALCSPCAALGKLRLARPERWMSLFVI